MATAKKKVYSIVARYELKVNAEELLEAILGYDATRSILKVTSAEQFLTTVNPKAIVSQLQSDDSDYLSDMLYDSTPTFELTEN